VDDGVRDGAPPAILPLGLGVDREGLLALAAAAVVVRVGADGAMWRRGLRCLGHKVIIQVRVTLVKWDDLL
jgi:hypothetical protein